MKRIPIAIKLLLCFVLLISLKCNLYAKLEFLELDSNIQNCINDIIEDPEIIYHLEKKFPNLYDSSLFNKKSIDTINERKYLKKKKSEIINDEFKERDIEKYLYQKANGKNNCFMYNYLEDKKNDTSLHFYDIIFFNDRGFKLVFGFVKKHGKCYITYVFPVFPERKKETVEIEEDDEN